MKMSEATQVEAPIEEIPVLTSDDNTIQDSMDEIIYLIKARVPLIYVVTHEETRFIEAFKKIAARKDVNREAWVWSSCMGLLQNFAKNIVTVAKGSEEKSENPKKALECIVAHETKASTKGNIYIMRDMHKVLSNDIPRMMRDMYEHLVNNHKTMVIVAPYLAYGPNGQNRGLEPTLEKQITVVNFDLPSRDQLLKTIKKIIIKLKNGKNANTIKTDYNELEILEFSRACQGLTQQETENVISTSIIQLRRIDVNRILKEKKNIIKKSDVLEYIDSDVSVADVGGMDEAKKFFDNYKDAFTDEAKAFGVEPLRGVLLTGVPGTGKSLLAKGVAQNFKLPLLRLDVGRVMAGVVGASEGRMREGIAMAEAIAPCVLWIDEVEKSISGTSSSGYTDGGTLSRVFGTLLTAMQEGMKDVMVVATANDISKLPPEFIRRFNEVFFVDLPSEDERRDIFKIHLKKRKRDPKKFDMAQLIKHSEDYTGAEIEKAVKDALALAWSSGKKEVVTSHLVQALSATKPIAKVMGEPIAELREWARNRARYASSEAALRAAPGNQQISANGKKYSISESLSDLSEVVKTDKELGKTSTEAEENSDRFGDIE
jgi:ATP-dependent 26S proteasome regulatory subunit